MCVMVMSWALTDDSAQEVAVDSATGVYREWDAESWLWDADEQYPHLHKTFPCVSVSLLAIVSHFLEWNGIPCSRLETNLLKQFSFLVHSITIIIS